MAQQVRVTTVPTAVESTPSGYSSTGEAEAYVIEMPVAGLKAEEILIEVMADAVAVSIKPEQAADSRGRDMECMEGAQASWRSQIFEFPVKIDSDNVRVSLENGILQIHVPKAASASRRVVPVGPPA